MAKTVDQDKEVNPIAEIFDEVFTLMQDLEMRSVALYEYLQEQGGATDEKLAPYMDRAAAAADVRWRAARARMEHLLAPKPRSSTDVGKDDKSKGASPSQSQEEGKGSISANSQAEKQQGGKPESKDLGKELGSAPTGTDTSPEKKDEKSQNEKRESEAKAKPSEQGSGKSKETSSKPRDAESQAAALAQGTKPESEKDADAKAAESGSGSPSNQQASEDKQQSQKAAK